jgi:hypothetical protein
MRDRLLERAAPQRRVAGLAPPFDGELRLVGLGEMMRDQLRLRVGRGDERLRRAPMQRLPAVLEQALVGRVLDERVFEAVC